MPLREEKRATSATPTARDSAHPIEAAPPQAALANLASLMVDWFWRCDERLRLTWVSNGFQAVTGIDPAPFIGKMRLDRLKAVSGSGESSPLQARAPFRDHVFELSGKHGYRHLLSIAGVPHFDDDGRFAGYHGVGRNSTGIQARRFDLSKLQHHGHDEAKARAQLALVLETLPAGVVIYDNTDRFVLGNRKIHDALPALAPAMVPGKSMREALEVAHAVGYFRESGDPELDRLYDIDREAWIEGYLKHYHVHHHVFERRNPDGRWFKVIDTRQEDGTFVGVRVDITELKQHEQELNKSMRENEVFQNLIDNVPVPIYVKRPDLKLMYVNKAWSDLLGVPAEQAIGKTDVELFGALGESFMEGDLAVLKTGQRQVIDETVMMPNGETCYQIARKDALVASDGSLYLLGSTIDVTELKRRERDLRIAQEKAVLADRAKSEFLANMSHEIRTPMNGVLGMAELLTKSELSSKQKTFVDIIVKSGNALLTIINDVLDFSKIDAGQLVLDPRPFNLAEAVEDVATLISPRAKEKDLELIVRVDPTLPETFVGDVGRIRQIVTNLLGNAVKFTEHGHVLVDIAGETENESTHLQVRVSDSGIGIPEDKLELIFDQFNQVDTSSTRRHEGTGLGLAITSRLIALMNGEIGVESKEGEGSTFWFTLSLPVASGAAGAKVAPRDVTGARVLVVDDNAVNRTILTEQMAYWGFDSCAANAADEGLRVLEAATQLGMKIDCAVIDYQMPDMNGLEMARAIRTDERFADTPIILLSSVDQSLSTGGSHELTIDAQLIKPARAASLLEALVHTIQKHRKDEKQDVSEDASPTASDRPAPATDRERLSIRSAVTARTKDRRAKGELDILVVEDNEVNQLVFKQILSETGLSFAIANNGKEAVESFASSRPGLILMDVSMPEMNGLEATVEIRRMEAEQGGHVPIIGVTAHALKGDRERCLEAGMDDYLSKPISPRALLEKIDRWSAAAQGGGIASN